MSTGFRRQRPIVRDQQPAGVICIKVDLQVFSEPTDPPRDAAPPPLAFCRLVVLGLG